MSDEALTLAVVLLILMAGVWLTVLTYIVLSQSRRSSKELVEEMKRMIKEERNKAKIIPLFNEMIEGERESKKKEKIKALKRRAKNMNVNEIAELLYDVDALVEQEYSVVVDEIFLVHASGCLIAHEYNFKSGHKDEDVFAGMLTVIQDFAKDSFVSETDQVLDTLNMGTIELVIERGEKIYLAAVQSQGNPKVLRPTIRKLVKDMEIDYKDALENWSGNPMDLPGVEARLRILLD